MQLAKDASEDKLRGGFYTPSPIAEFILKWGFNGKKDVDILEPSCGDGVFLSEIKKGKYEYNRLTAIELDAAEAQKAAAVDLPKSEIINQDFHSYCINTDKRFDLIIGNPPYIRYQYFDKQQQEYAGEIFKKADLKYSKLTNAWVSFIVGSTLLLKDTGKIGFVLPAEILQVSYAKQLRTFIAQQYNKINIVSFEKLVFLDIQQEVVLLLCEKNGSNDHLIEHLEVVDSSDLKDLDLNLLRAPQKHIDFRSNKWTFYFLSQEEIDFLENVSTRHNISKIGDYADVEVGITTGANNYFTVPQTIVDEYNLQEYARPMVGRSVQVESVVFNNQDWEQNNQTGAKANLLVFPARNELEQNEEAMRYIAYGEENEINGGYKCGIREDWFVIPSIRLSDAFFIRRNGTYPRIIVNQADAYTTDTMHRVFLKEETDMNALVASFYNSLSLASAEISGRSYGGGVLELMPSETEKILLPYHLENAELLQEINDMMRNNTPIEEILNMTNQRILIENFGFTPHEVELANSIWQKLLNRRINRKK